MTQLHATAIAIDDQGVLIRGPSGSGKSDLALRLIADGAVLVADDRVEVNRVGDALHLTAPNNLTGFIEVRGIGVVDTGNSKDAPLRLIVDLKSSDDIERLPEPALTTIDGITVPVVELNGFEISAVTKIKLALRLQKGEVALVT